MGVPTLIPTNTLFYSLKNEYRNVVEILFYFSKSSLIKKYLYGNILLIIGKTKTHLYAKQWGNSEVNYIANGILCNQQNDSYEWDGKMLMERWLTMQRRHSKKTRMRRQHVNRQLPLRNMNNNPSLSLYFWYFSDILYLFLLL